MNDPRTSGPLQQVRVLDMTGDVGCVAGKLLAEFGADVVRVLPGERGPDLTGPSGPGLLELWHDAGCRRSWLDLDDTEDVVRLRAMVEHCDIVFDGQPAEAMAGRGLSPADLAAVNPALVHVSISPQGADGPRASWKSSDLVAQALGGYLSVTGDPDRPVPLWGRQAATVGGFYAAFSALAGLNRARLTGRGAHVDLSVHQALVSCSEHLLMYWWFPEALAALGAPIAGRQRSLHWIRAFEVVPCARGACMVSPAAGGLLGLIAWLKERGHAADVPDEPSDEELLGLVPPLMQALKDVALESDATDLFEAGQSLHVPFGEAYSVPQVAACAQHVERGFFRPVALGEPAEDGAEGSAGDSAGDGVEGAAAGDAVDRSTAAADLRMPGPLARLRAAPLPAPRSPRSVTVDQVLAEWQNSMPPWPEATSADPMLPLSGLRVLDFTHVLAGPFATRLLADLGADVIRVQTEERSAGTSTNDFPYNVMWARSKRSIQLQMKHPEAITVLRGLVEQADVVIDNFSAGIMDGWGAGPRQLEEWNPKIISMSMTGCGADGPWEKYVTYAPTVHALCGLTALTGPPGETDCGPGIAYNDHLSGLAGAIAVLAAVEHRQRTGTGQHIDLSQFEVGTYLVGPALVDYFATGRVSEATGTTDPFADHLVNDVFPTVDDQWLAVTVENGEDWDAVAAVLRSAEPEDTDAREVLARWIAGRTGFESQEALQRAGVAAGLVQNAGHLADDDEQLAHRDWLVTMDSPMIGQQTTERHPGRWFIDGMEAPLPYGPSPYLGEHNFEVYQELLGWDAERVAMAIGDELIM